MWVSKKTYSNTPYKYSFLTNSQISTLSSLGRVKVLEQVLVRKKRKK